MASTTNVPLPTIGPNGIIVPQESAIRSGVLADWQGAFDGNLNPSPATPQGQLIDVETFLLGALNDLYAFYVSQTDPAYATGRMQDAIARIYFLSRLPQRATTVQCVCSGSDTTIIPVGALAKATDGNIYACTTAGTIFGGSVTLPFACTTYGPIFCAAGTLNQVYRTIAGWSSITNPADGVVGADEEGRAAFEARRAASVAVNALGTIDAIRAAVLQVPGVIDAYVNENPTAAPVTKGGVSLAANSLYVAVAGGDLDAVARAIWTKKMPGSAYTGTTTRTVYDTNAGYASPYPSYSVTFTVPTSVPIKFAVTIANSPTVPSDAAGQIADAIGAEFAGTDDGVRERIGGTVYASRYYAAIASLGSWARIISVKVGTTTATLDDVTLNIDQVPTFDAGNVTVTLA